MFSTLPTTPSFIGHQTIHSRIMRENSSATMASAAITRLLYLLKHCVSWRMAADNTFFWMISATMVSNRRPSLCHPNHPCCSIVLGILAYLPLLHEFRLFNEPCGVQHRPSPAAAFPLLHRTPHSLPISYRLPLGPRLHPIELRNLLASCCLCLSGSRTRSNTPNITFLSTFVCALDRLMEFDILPNL
jgi:hypothetical protein